MEDAACYLLSESLQNYIDYAAYGRDLQMEGNFVVTNHGVFEIVC